MAVATDCNPGSSPLCSLLMAANLACALFRMTPEEVLAGITREAARALGLAGRLGTLEAGKEASFAVWKIGHPRELAYWMGGVGPEAVVQSKNVLF
jgi:imidazolonepropionase